MPKCKVGDLAIVIHSKAGNEGKIIKCVRFIPNHRFDLPVGPMDAWEMDRSLPCFPSGTNRFVPDAWLKPLRGENTEKELIDAIQSEA